MSPEFREKIEPERQRVETRATVVDDPVGVCLMLMANGQHALAATTARRYLATHEDQPREGRA